MGKSFLCNGAVLFANLSLKHTAPMSLCFRLFVQLTSAFFVIFSFFLYSFLYYFSTADVQIRQRGRSAQRWEDEGEESKAKQEWQEELR